MPAGITNGTGTRMPPRNFNKQNLSVANNPNAASNMQAFQQKTNRRMTKFANDPAKQAKIQNNFNTKSQRAGWR